MERNRQIAIVYHKRLYGAALEFLSPGEIRDLGRIVRQAVREGFLAQDVVGNSIVIKLYETSFVLIEEISLRRAALLALWLYRLVFNGFISIDRVRQLFGEDVVVIIDGLNKIRSLYAKNPSIESENFSSLLLTFAQDVRVIFIMLADRLQLLRLFKMQPDSEHRRRIANEAAYLYAPLAHRLGLYNIKSEMENLWLFFTNEEKYRFIENKLQESQPVREQYITDFINPVKQRIEEEHASITFSIKGRTKSVHSIWNKLRKQQIEFEKIYDIFAIRIIVDVPEKDEKAICWHLYSIITDMYQPNPQRMKDWISIPKSNGYESLHITVLGPDKRWVEVQIRSRRMDEVAEKGMAAHWRYKGGKEKRGMDGWLANVREVLEQEDASVADVMAELKPNFYNDEIFVFTPKGDLYKLTQGATVLDFAFSIHSNLGARCVGAKINGVNTTIKQVLNSGDQVEILTSSNQKPSSNWLNIVVTTKAKSKIKQCLKETENKESEFGKELFMRRLKNRKIEFDESILMRLIKLRHYKTVTSFFVAVSQEKLEINSLIEGYLELGEKDRAVDLDTRTVQDFIPAQTIETSAPKEDVLVIDDQLKNIDFKLAKCCSPIYGDAVFGFVSALGGIKIHRASCPNAPDMYARFGYRIVKAQWSGKSGSQYPITLHIVGNDDIGILTNISSIINKESNTQLRSISIDTNAGLFSGHLTVLISDTTHLNALVKKLKTVKGVKSIGRINE